MKHGQYVLFFGLLGLDQLGSWYIRQHHSLETHRWFTALPGMWSWGVAIGILILIRRTWLRDAAYRLSFTLMLAGASSNALTFLFFSKVFDYLPLGPFFLNIADLCILTGIVWSSGLFYQKTLRQS